MEKYMHIPQDWSRVPNLMSVCNFNIKMGLYSEECKTYCEFVSTQFLLLYSLCVACSIILQSLVIRFTSVLKSKRIFLVWSIEVRSRGGGLAADFATLQTAQFAKHPRIWSV